MSDVSRVEAVFVAATELADPSARAAYLDAACGGDAGLRRRVEELLATHPKVGRFLEPPPAATAAHLPATEAHGSGEVGQVIDGRYKLLERIGEGGMGQVWVADQLAPVRRRVALKLIKPGMDSRGVLARFEAERQALAVMDHPNIARVFDAGTTPDGRPYFVMELVKGTPITEFADARRLTPRQRLELVVPVCQAIQHAHMKGIIHRDIKPSNVLVALHDETPVPKVIDFGIAKAVGQQLTEKTIYTGFGALVGTPAYMAPEQATFNQLDVDTRADVYALGVLLYELLAGSPPIEADRLKKAALDEILRLVRDEEPPRPSQRLSTSQGKAGIAAVRGGEPAGLSALLRGEIDWIVMKALEKDRTRRYESATGLGRDIQRYLAGDAVEACPPTLGYRVRKAYRRNRAAVRAAGAFTLLLLAAVAVSGWLAVKATRAEAVAVEKELEAQENADAWGRLSEVYLTAAIDAQIRSESARLDADLLEYTNDRRVGLLRLARPLKHTVGPLPLIVPGVGPGGTTVQSFPNEPELVKLREFQVAAVVAAGQEFVPLVPSLGVPPLGFHNSSESFKRVSPDYRRYIGGDERHGLELRTLPDSIRIGTLREGTERVLELGFSPDGQTVFTQDVDSVVRFWNTDGTLRAKTPMRPERFVYPPGLSNGDLRWAKIGNPLLVADGVALLWSEQRVGVKPGTERDSRGNPGPKGPTDLYSTRTGKHIRRLDRPNCYILDMKLAASSRWLVYHEYQHNAGAKHPDSQLVVVSAEDGSEVARLSHPTDKPVFDTCISPTGKWVLTVQDAGVSDDGSARHKVHLWRSADWMRVEDAALTETLIRIKEVHHPEFVTDDVLDLYRIDGFSSSVGMFHIGRPGLRASNKSLGTGATDFWPVVGELCGRLLRCDRRLTSAETFELLKQPEGRKYAAELAMLAPDGRFWRGLDTVTEKDLPYFREGQYFPGLGQVGVRCFFEEDEPPFLYDDTELRILPDPKRLDIPADLLQLWAQAVAGGELGPDGRFEPWDQPTWAAKQRQLAAAKPPYPDFPFPGLAADPNVWHLVRVKQLRHGPERDRHLDEWHRRSGRLRPDLGPDTWRTTEPAPPPRVVKN